MFVQSSFSRVQTDYLVFIIDGVDLKNKTKKTIDI